MELRDLLKESGLRDSEIKVYVYLLSYGASSPPAIAKATKIARPNCYGILRSLLEKELIDKHVRGKRKTYAANDPSSLVHALELRKKAIERALPDLRALYVVEKNKPSIRFFEGAEQVKQIFIEILDSEEKEVFGVASTKHLFEALSVDFFKSWENQMKKKGIFLNDILTSESFESVADIPKKAMKAYYTSRSLPESAGDLPSDILIWDDNIALISIEKPIYGTVIRNRAIAKTMRVMFDQTWKSL